MGNCCCHKDHEHGECCRHEHEHGHNHGHEHGGEENPKKEIIRIAAGAVLFALGFAAGFTGLPDVFRYALLALSYLVLGGPVLLSALKGIIHGELFDETFLMSIATIGAAVLGEYNEAVFVMLFYSVGEFAQDLAADKARDNIEELMELEPSHAKRMKEDGSIEEIEPETVEIGDVLLVPAGEMVPVDGIALNGSVLDTKAVTGESVPVCVHEGSEVVSGAFVTGQALKVRACVAFEDSTVSRIMELVENSRESKAPTEKFITRFARVYTPVVTGLAVLLAVVPSLITGDWATWTHRALTFLVISCPCALVLSIPLSFFAGIGGAASKGILVKGGTHLQTLARVETVAFDKTGTLTTGEFKVQKVFVSEGVTEQDVLDAAGAVERHSTHPVAKVLASSSDRNTDAKEVKEYSGRGMEGTVDGKKILVGNAGLMKENGIDTGSLKDSGEGTGIYVASDGKLLGYVVIGDRIKDNAKQTVQDLRKLGISRIVMLSGDREENARRIGEQAGLDMVYGQLLPQQKVEKMEELKKSSLCAYVGDGINDAPVLMTADCAIAMGGVGSASAIEAADVVIMNDDISRIPLAVRIAAKTLRNAKQNICFAIGVKVACMVLGALGITGMGIAVFADTGVALLCVLNSMRTLHVGESC